MTSKLDVAYLQGLSAHAVPVVDRLPEPMRSCLLGGMPAASATDGGSGVGAIGGWNRARSRAHDLLAAHPAITSLPPCA
jgi:hypothetical protein